MHVDITMESSTCYCQIYHLNCLKQHVLKYEPVLPSLASTMFWEGGNGHFALIEESSHVQDIRKCFKHFTALAWV